jgi:hypothetical protein
MGNAYVTTPQSRCYKLVIGQHGTSLADEGCG